MPPTALAAAKPDNEVDDPPPRLGDTVTYMLTDADAGHLTQEPHRRFTTGVAGQANPYMSAPADAGSVVPAVITGLWSPATVNIRILPDGPQSSVWLPSRTRGPGPGQWEPRS